MQACAEENVSICSDLCVKLSWYICVHDVVTWGKFSCKKMRTFWIVKCSRNLDSNYMQGLLRTHSTQLNVASSIKHECTHCTYETRSSAVAVNSRSYRLQGLRCAVRIPTGRRLTAVRSSLELNRQARRTNSALFTSLCLQFRFVYIFVSRCLRFDFFGAFCG